MRSVCGIKVGSEQKAETEKRSDRGKERRGRTEVKVSPIYRGEREPFY